jgi:hypothetical protein
VRDGLNAGVKVGQLVAVALAKFLGRHQRPVTAGAGTAQLG